MANLRNEYFHLQRKEIQHQSGMYGTNKPKPRFSPMALSIVANQAAHDAKWRNETKILDSVKNSTN
jgi:hypothetical protein